MAAVNPPPYSAVREDSKGSMGQSVYPVQAPGTVTAVSVDTKEGEAVPLAEPVEKRMSFGVMDAERVKSQTVKYLRYVPAMPMGLAITFFCINCVIPGIGTMLAALFLPCVGNTVKKSDSTFLIALLNFLIAFPMLLLSGLGLGYMVAIWWSYATVGTNRMYYRRPVEDSEIVDGGAMM